MQSLQKPSHYCGQFGVVQRFGRQKEYRRDYGSQRGGDQTGDGNGGSGIGGETQQRQKQQIEKAVTTLEMDKIRARGFLKFTYNYDPLSDIERKIESAAQQCAIEMDQSDWRVTELADFEKKEKFLLSIGKQCAHFVPNSKLHKMKTVGDVAQFYETPISNISKYAAMARSGDQMPKNLAIMEHQRRFHPNDKTAPHGGITAYPGELGKVLGLRNKRLYREYRPKKHWYEFEDMVFDCDVNCSKGMPWDPEVAKRMDSYTEVKFVKDHLIKKF